MSATTLLTRNWRKFRSLLARDVNGSSLAFFRFVFGVVMLYMAIKYLYPQGNTSLKEFLYEEPSFNFTYAYFEWVKPLPEPLWTFFFCLMGLAAIGVAIGLFYRASAITLFLTYTYVFLSELGKYNNHYYLMCLVAFLLACMPAGRVFSIDSWRSRRKEETSPSESLVPFWPLFLLRFQLFVVYFYGGIAKINSDWLTGIPMLGKGKEILDFWAPLLHLPEIDHLHVALFICWFGLFYDLSIGFLLLIRRTRWFGIALTALFHASNHFLFPIGVFPTMALATTLIFFEPDWPMRFYSWLRKPRFRAPDRKWFLGGLILIPPVGALLGWADRKSGRSPKSTAIGSLTLYFLSAFVLIQVLFPFRHFFIPGDANWTEQGQDFSWRMMLRMKDASHVIYHVWDDQIISENESGNSVINWDNVPEEARKLLFVPIESSLFNWEHHSGLTATFEPGVGLRLVYHLKEGDDMEKLQNDLSMQWKQLFGRNVPIVESIGLDEALTALSQATLTKEQRDYILPAIDRIQALRTGLTDRPPLAQESDLALIAGEVEILAEEVADLDLPKSFRHLHPFLLQGTAFPGQQFLVVDDPAFTVDSRDSEKLTNGQEMLVWMDLGRIRAEEWKKLPQWFFTFENRQLKIIWNYGNDLNSIQKKRFTTSPWMIRQFARFIAGQWEDNTGRRPKVTVISNLMLNFRTPQPLIDPEADLASVDYKFMRSNDWVLPLSATVGSATNRGKGKDKE